MGFQSSHPATASGPTASALAVLSIMAACAGACSPQHSADAANTNQVAHIPSDDQTFWRWSVMGNQETPKSSPPANNRAESSNTYQDVPPSTDAPAPNGDQSPGLSDSLTAQQQRLLQIFGPTLLNPSPDIQPELRRNAARELLEMGLPEAIAIVDSALRSGQPVIVSAALGAMQSYPQPVPELMDAAIMAIPGASPDLLESISWVVARYGQPAQQRVAAMAQDNSASLSSRLGSIHVLGSFCTHDAAGSLISLMNQATQTPNSAASATILKAVCTSLERMTGLSYGADIEQWRRWWRTAEVLPADAWTQFMVDSLGERVADLQRQLQHQSKRIFETYRDLYPALAVDEQIRRLPQLLDDELAPVREFGISRAALLVRDSIRLPEDVQQKIAMLMDDPEPALRLQALRLTTELNYERLPVLLAERLAEERSPQLVLALLESAMKRPSAGLLEPARRWLSDAELGPKAAAVMCRILENGASAPEPQLAQLREAARNAVAKHPCPGTAKLLALVGDEHDISSLTELLANDEAAMRAAVAEGFAHRGVRQPLLDRADDQAIYPSLLRVLADGPADLANFGVLVGLVPAEPMAKAWRDAVLKLAGRLAPSDLLAADDVLAASTAIDISLRHDLLLRAIDLPPESLNADLRVKVLLRLTPMLIELGKAARAHELLENFAMSANGAIDAPLIASMRFQAAALSGHYDLAAQLQPDPQAWVGLLTRIAQRDAAAAMLLRDEIVRRFGANLDEATRRELDRIGHAIGLHEFDEARRADAAGR